MPRFGLIMYSNFLLVGTLFHTLLAAFFPLLCHPAASEPGLGSGAGETQSAPGSELLRRGFFTVI